MTGLSSARTTIKYENHFKSVNIRVRTPSGKVFLTFMDDDAGNLIRIIPFVGKAGSEVSAWIDGLTTMINFGLDNHTLNPSLIIGLLDGIYSHGLTRSSVNGRWVYSGVNGVVDAVREYIKAKASNTSKRSYRASIR